MNKMKKITSLIATFALCLILFGASISNAEYVPTNDYFPLTVEKAEQAWEDVRSQHFEVEFPSDTWANKVKVILTTMDMSTNNYDYFRETYDLDALEAPVFLASPAKPTGVDYKADEFPWTIPDKIYINKNIPLYWIMNKEVLDGMDDDDTLRGFIMHEMVHMYDWRLDKGFTEYTSSDIGLPNRHPLGYTGREKLVDAYLFCTKYGDAVIPMYKFTQWVSEFLCPYFASMGCVDGKIPVEGHPHIDYMTVQQTWDGNDIKRFFFRPIEYSLKRERMTNPDAQPCDILDEVTCDAYNYLMNN